MATVTNLGPQHGPRLVRNIFGLPTENRDSLKVTAKSSAAVYIGSFVSLAELGLTQFADEGIIFGFVKNITRHGSLLNIWNDGKRVGTITATTGDVPAKYTFGSTNDKASASPTLEEIEVVPIFYGDILEVTLWGASASPVARATTTAEGTTTSSANVGVYMPVNTTYTFALTEASASASLSEADFQTVQVDGQLPANAKHVYALCKRSANSELATT